MSWLPAFFICSAIAASVQGLPGITRYLKEDFYSESQSKDQFFQHIQRPLLKDKISMHDSPTVEFIHQDQSKAQKDQYMNNSIATDNDEKKSKTGSQPSSKDDLIEIVNESKATKKGMESFVKTFLKGDKTKEASITGSLPKYGILPISAFPVAELRETTVLKKEKLTGFPMTQKSSQPTQIAGPMPYPQSTYAREFDLPFYEQ